MEKLKNLVNPGSKKDDEVLYGSGRSDDPVHSGPTGTQSGQGSHFGNSRTAGNEPVSSSTNPTSGTGFGSNTTTSGSGLGSNTTDNDPLSTFPNPTGGNQYSSGLNEPYASRMPGGFDDDAITTASVRSGVPGQTTQTGSGMTGTNDPTLSTNKPLPREPGTTGTGLTGSSGNNMAGGSSLAGNNYPDRSVGSSGLGDQSTGSSHLGRDAAVGASGVGAGAAAHHHHHENAQRDNYAPETGRSFPLGGSSNTTSGSNYPSGQTGTYPAGGAMGSTTAGPHSSSLANKADPRVDSDLDGSRTAGNTASNTGYGSGTGATPSSTHQGSLGRDAALGAGAGAGAGVIGSSTTSGGGSYGAESWEHEHDKHGHNYEGDPCGPGETAASGPHFVQGPHATDTANRLDPHVAGGTGGVESTAGHHHGHHGYRKEEAALAGGATGAGLGAYEGSRDNQGTTTGSSMGSGLGSSTTGTGVRSSTGPALNTAGPHKSDMLNKLDPRVDSDLSKEQHSTGTSGTGLGSSTTGASDPFSSQTTGRDHYHGKEEAAVGGAGLAGAAAYGEKHHRSNEPTFTNSTSGTSNLANPYSSSDVDPRLGSGRPGLDDTTGTTGTGNDHHLGRDAAVGAGAGGLAYEAERHHGKPTQSSTIPSNTTGRAYDNTRGPAGYDQAGSQLAGSGHQPATTKDHHYGRDTGLAGATGVGAYEADKHLGSNKKIADTTPKDPGYTTYESSGYSNPEHQHNGREHHTGRDAAVGGAALGAGAAGVDEHEMFRKTGRTDPGTTVREHQHPGASIATYPSPGYGHENDLPGSGHHGHHKEEETLAGGAAAGGLAHHEHSKKDEKALGKEQGTGRHGHRKEEEALAGGAAAGGLAHHEHSKKDEKALEKEQSKELKQHDKAVAKEEKALEKDEKQHEKERAKHQAAIEKDQKKHEHDGEKKHGGLLGLLHRGKHDKDVKEPQVTRDVADNRTGDEMAAGSGAGSYANPLAGEHGSQSGVHDTPIGTGPTTRDAYGTAEGHNKLHKDPPAKILEGRGADYQGHGNVN